VASIFPSPYFLCPTPDKLGEAYKLADRGYPDGRQIAGANKIEERFKAK
jgi:hypothetical protein